MDSTIKTRGFRPWSGGIQVRKQRRSLQRICLAGLFVALAVAFAQKASAETRSGNEFALQYSEASTDAQRSEILKDARNRLYFFRYLQIMEISEKKDEQGRSSFEITAFEPSSLMDVVFNVNQNASVSVLLEEPRSKQGDAIAVTGRIESADKKSNTIKLNPVIVRYKDRLSPATGKEMLYEVKPGGVFYSFTEGPRPILLSYRDRDLLQHRKRILEKEGPRAWFEFLEKNLKEREKSRERGADAPQ